MATIECANCSDDVRVAIEVTKDISDEPDEEKMVKELWCLACVHREMQTRLKDEEDEDQE